MVSCVCLDKITISTKVTFKVFGQEPNACGTRETCIFGTEF